MQEPSWSPDGKRIAVSYLDRLWTMTPDGKQARAIFQDLKTSGPQDRGEFQIEREPAWSPDGTRLAFAADRGDGFDIFVVAIKNGVAVGSPVAVTTMAGDERWPSWTADGRLVFAHRDARPAGRNGDPSLQYDIYLSTPVAGSDAWQAPHAADRNGRQRNLSARVAGRHQGRVRFGARVRRRSRSVVDAGAVGGNRQADSARRPSAEAGVLVGASRLAPMASRLRATRITRVRGNEAYPSWAPDNTRLAFYAVREGIGSVWVATAEPPRPEPAEDPIAAREAGGAAAAGVRRGGAPAWSPDGKTLLVSGLPDPQPVYNGNPLRNETEAPPLFALNARSSCGASPRRCRCTKTAARCRPRSRRRRRSSARCSIACGRTLQSLYYSTGATCGAVGDRARQVPSARDGGEDRSRSRDRDRRDGRGAAADQAGDHVERRGRRVRASAGVGSRPPRLRKGRQRRRRDDRRVVRARRRRARSVRRRRRWIGGALSSRA